MNQPTSKTLTKEVAGSKSPAGVTNSFAGTDFSKGNLERKRYRDLNAERDRGVNRWAKTSSNKIGGIGSASGAIKTLSNPQNLVSPVKKIKLAKDAVSLLSSIDFDKDSMQMIVIMVSLIADVFTLIPLLNSFFAFFFSIAIWVLYAMDGNFGNKNLTRKITVAISSQAVEILGVGVLGILPMFTLSAVVNYWLVLLERQSTAKTA